MKKLWLLPCITVIFITACGKNVTADAKSKKGDSTQTSNVKVDNPAFEIDSFHVYEKEKKCNDQAGECAYCDLYYEKIKTASMPVHDSVNTYIDNMVLKALNEMSSESQGYDLKKRALEFIKTSNDPDFDDGGTWNWDHHTSITRSVQEVIAVNSSWGGYMGGAHGDYNAETANFFTSNGKRVTMGDLFKDVNAVNKMAVKYFKKDNELEADVDLSEQGWDFSDNEFQLNDNFDISLEKITWQFNSYEIGPYSNGAPEVSIPMKDLQKHLKVKFTEVVIQ